MRIKNDKTLILNKIKLHYQFKTDAEFARFLDIKPNSLANWYARNTLDYERLFSKCEYINANWLLSGEGEMFAEVANLNVHKKNDNQISGKKDEDFLQDDSNPEAMVEYWRGEYISISKKYQLLQEEYNMLLKDKLKEILEQDKSASAS